MHRLVAKEFLENPDNLEFVHHKDNNKLNNHVDNLQWVTRSENNSKQLRQPTNVSRGKPVLCIDKNDFDNIKRFNTTVEASKFMDAKNSGNTTIACQYNDTISNGYLFSIYHYKGNKAFTPLILRKDPNTGLVDTYETYEDAALDTDLSKTNVEQCCYGKYKTLKGFIWQYVKEDKLNDIIQQINREIEFHKSDGVNVFTSIAEATKHTGHAYETIIRMLKNKDCFVYKGDVPEKVANIENKQLPKHLHKRYVNGHARPIKCINSKTGDIKVFKSIMEASKELKLNSTKISEYRKNKTTWEHYTFEDVL